MKYMYINLIMLVSMNSVYGMRVVAHRVLPARPLLQRPLLSVTRPGFALAMPRVCTVPFRGFTTPKKSIEEQIAHEKAIIAAHHERCMSIMQWYEKRAKELSQRCDDNYNRALSGNIYDNARTENWIRRDSASRSALAQYGRDVANLQKEKVEHEDRLWGEIEAAHRRLIELQRQKS